MKDETRITPDYRIEYKHWVWSAVFLAPFPDYKSADNWRRMNWPDAKHLEVI
jgi:hypothetical protein